MPHALNFFRKYESWIRTAVLLLSIAFLHYFDDRYVSRTNYAEDQRSLNTSISSIRDSLASIRESVIGFDQARDALKDHETRLRRLEHRP